MAKSTRHPWTPYTNAKGIPVKIRWWDDSPINRAALCDRCGRRVERTEMRCQVDDGEGPERKSGKGKAHTWLCTDCAINIPLPMIQPGLFDE